MKALFRNIICATAVSLAVSSLAYSADNDYYVNGIRSESAAPQQKGDWLLVPIKPIGEGIGFEFSTNENKLIFQKEDLRITFIPGVWRAYIDGNEKKISYPVYIEDGVAYAEINDLSKVFNCTIEYHENDRNFKVTLKGAQTEETVKLTDAPALKIENKEPNIFSFQTRANGLYLESKKPYEIVWKNSDYVLNNIYRTRIDDKIKFSFDGTMPDRITVQREALPEYNENGIEEVYPVNVEFVKTETGYEFECPIIKDDVTIYIIDASWGGNSFEYLFVMDNTKVIESVKGLDEVLSGMDMEDFTVVKGKVYYIDKSNLMEIRGMLLDGTENNVVAEFPVKERITDSYEISSEYANGIITYKVQETGKYGGIDTSEGSVMPPPRYFRFDIKTGNIYRYEP